MKVPFAKPTDASGFSISRRRVLQGGSAALAMMLSGCAPMSLQPMSQNTLNSSLADHPMHPTRLPLSGWLDWEDPQSGHIWRVWIQMPEAPAPAEGYPALVVMDGNAIFPLAAQWARLQQTRPAYVRGEPCVIIGIGHPVDALFDTPNRRRDFTPPATNVETPEGGADVLLDFLQNILLADWIKRIPLNPKRLGLYGHSLSGLFVLHSLFTRPTLFADYYAVSPSIWWNDAFLLQEQENFVREHAALFSEQGPLQSNVFLYAGSLEEPTGEARPANAPPTGKRHTVRLQITRAREMAEQLQALQWPHLRAQFHLWPDLTHGDTMMPSLMQAVGNMSMPKQWKDADFGLRSSS